MELRPFIPETDFEKIKGWISNEREHAMWCVNRFRYPLDKDDFLNVLSELKLQAGDVPVVAEADGKAAGFFCCSVNGETKECKLRFIVVDPERRGKGTAREMLRLAVSRAFRDTCAECVLLSVFPINIRAKKCYESVGFSESGTDAGAFSFGDEVWERRGMIIKK